MIAWVDVETTGLHERTGHLLEVAFVITDDNLVEQAALSLVLRPVGIEIADAVMEPIVREMHEKNGLLKEVAAGGMRRYQAEGMFMDWLVDRFETVDFKKVPLAGSTVSFDRKWLHEQMPRLESMFHYRNIDVSTLTELAQRWAPNVYERRPKSEKAHRALLDVRESIAYLDYYREIGFVG